MWVIQEFEFVAESLQCGCFTCQMDYSEDNDYKLQGIITLSCTTELVQGEDYDRGRTAEFSHPCHINIGAQARLFQINKEKQIH